MIRSSRADVSEPGRCAADYESLRHPSQHTSWRIIAATVLALAVATTFIILAARDAEHATLASEVVASHIRSLMPGHVVDVATDDVSVVQAWFAGSVDFAVPIPPLQDAGFPLLGARLDYIRGRRAAVAVYGQGRHVLNVYSWRIASPDSTAPRAETARGYQLLHWQQHGQFTCVISDLDSRAVRAFAALLRAAS